MSRDVMLPAGAGGGSPLQRRPNGPLRHEDWQIIKEQAAVLIESGLLPAHIKSPEAAIAVMIKGWELGVSAMQALSNIVVVNGKPTCNSELMLALIYRDHGDDALQFVESTSACCTISYRRRGWSARREYSFTIEHAVTAGLSGLPSWRKYPAAMLRARCISAVARMAFPDSISGMYTYEEMGLPVDVREGEQVLVATAVDARPEGKNGCAVDTNGAQPVAALSRKGAQSAAAVNSARAAADMGDGPASLRAYYETKIVQAQCAAAVEGLTRQIARDAACELLTPDEAGALRTLAARHIEALSAAGQTAR